MHTTEGSAFEATVSASEESSPETLIVEGDWLPSVTEELDVPDAFELPSAPNAVKPANAKMHASKAPRNAVEKVFAVLAPLVPCEEWDEALPEELCWVYGVEEPRYSFGGSGAPGC